MRFGQFILCAAAMSALTGAAVSQNTSNCAPGSGVLARECDFFELPQNGSSVEVALLDDDGNRRASPDVRTADHDWGGDRTIYVAGEYQGTIKGDVDVFLRLRDVFTTVGSGSVVTMKLTLNDGADAVFMSAPDEINFEDVECDFVMEGGIGDRTLVYRSNSRVDQCGVDETRATSQLVNLEILVKSTQTETLRTGKVVLKADFTSSPPVNYAGRSFEFPLIEYVRVIGSYPYSTNVEQGDLGKPDALLLQRSELDDWTRHPETNLYRSDEWGLMGALSTEFRFVTPRDGDDKPIKVLDTSQTLPSEPDIGDHFVDIKELADILLDTSTVRFTFEGTRGLESVYPTSVEPTPTQAGNEQLPAPTSGVRCGTPVSLRISCTLSASAVQEASGSPIRFRLRLNGIEVSEDTLPQDIGFEFEPAERGSYYSPGLGLLTTGTLGEDDGVETVRVGPFPWTSLRPSGGTRSAFRISGMKARPGHLFDEDNAAAEGAHAIVVRLDGVYRRDLEGVAPTGSVMTIYPAPLLSDGREIVHLEEDPLNGGEYVATFTTEGLAQLLGTQGGVNADISLDITLPDGTDTSALKVVRLLTRDGSVGGTGFDSYDVREVVETLKVPEPEE